jgi:peptidoglycan/xylan/chitin deacetylase (PgdA/CDA1 family)
MHPALNITPVVFEKQIEWLAANGYVAIGCGELDGWLSSRGRIPSKSVLITFEDGYSDICRYAVPVLDRRNFPAIVFLVTALLGKTNEWDEKSGWAKWPLLSEQQVRECAARGIEFGAHSRTHVDPAAIGSTELESQVDGSARDLEAIIGELPASFAYPYGSVNDAVRDRVGRSFKLGMTTQRGLNSTTTDRRMIRRLFVGPRETSFGFSWMLRFGFSPLLELRRRVRLKAHIRSFTHATP